MYYIKFIPQNCDPIYIAYKTWNNELFEEIAENIAKEYDSAYCEWEETTVDEYTDYMMDI